MSKLCEVRPEVRCSPEGFFSAVEVWVKKPHVVNKRLCGVKEDEGQTVFSEDLPQTLALLTRTIVQDLDEVLLFLHTYHAESGPKPGETWHVGVRTIIPKVGPNPNEANVFREIIVKNLTKKTVTFLPIEENREGHITLQQNNIYQIQLEERADDSVLSLLALRPDQWYSDGVAYPKLSWLSAELLPKLARWAIEAKSSEFKSTLSLIPVEKYSTLYQELKNKYKKIVKVWPEVTDPEKFVFEDVAIATYLLVLWGEERAAKGETAKQSFVDLGCGNGLLVHILNNEGHPGKGIDVRKRKIWDMYGPSTHLEVYEACSVIYNGWFSLGSGIPYILWTKVMGRQTRLSGPHPYIQVIWNGKKAAWQDSQSSSAFFGFIFQASSFILTQTRSIIQEKAITPSTNFLFPETDWLIGNHSDELTPWIPVIAARSSYSCRYFVLPCCFFDFYGKYQRRQCKKSQYREYIDFISEVSVACGFQTEEDCLRIPSTKRVCLIGKSRCYEEPEEEQAEVRRTEYIRGRQTSCTRSTNVMQKDCSSHHGDGQEISELGCEWGSGFQPREKTETVRNCAALPRDLVDCVVLKVALALLGLSAEAGEEENTSTLRETNKWNAGGSLSIREVAELLDQSTLQILKKECGGLQTLLKNSHQVFRVFGGRVHIRDWRTSSPEPGTHVNSKHKSQISGALKTRLCWFHTHHPHGCPLSTEDCLFAHGADDLRPSTRPLKKIRS